MNQIDWIFEIYEKTKLSVACAVSVEGAIFAREKCSVTYLILLQSVLINLPTVTIPNLSQLINYVVMLYASCCL